MKEFKVQVFEIIKGQEVKLGTLMGDKDHVINELFRILSRREKVLEKKPE